MLGVICREQKAKTCKYFLTSLESITSKDRPKRANKLCKIVFFFCARLPPVTERPLAEAKTSLPAGSERTVQEYLLYADRFIPLPGGRSWSVAIS
jgi:hypothetical protein